MASLVSTFTRQIRQGSLNLWETGRVEVSKLIMPNIGEGVSKKDKDKKVSFLAKRLPTEFNHVKISVTSKVSLDGLELLYPDSTRWVIFFLGQGQLYERHLPALKELSERTGSNVLCFNWRGLGKSTGRPVSSASLVQDGLAVVDFLKAKGVTDIVVHGHSLGGGPAAAVGVKRPSIKVVLDRTFDKLSSVAEGNGHKVMKLVRRVAVRAFGWEFDNGAAVKTLKQRAMTIVHKQDPRIPFDKSIHQPAKESKRHILTGGDPKKAHRSYLKGHAVYKAYMEHIAPKVPIDEIEALEANSSGETE